MSRDYIEETTYTHKCGKQYNVRWYYDHDMGSPLDWSDGHGVTERMDWNPTNDEQLEQHIIDEEPELEEETRLRMMRRLSPHDRYNSGLYYDVLSSLHLARTEWGVEPDRCMEVVEADYNYLKGWYDDDWCWITVGVAPLNDKGKPVEDYRAFCGGYESTILETYGDKAEDNAKYREEIINEQIHQVEHDIRNALYPNQMELLL